MMRRTELGGRVNGMEEDLETRLCPSQLVNSLSRLSKCPCGVPISCLHISCCSS